ncbi:MAG: hypothetical protein IJ563_02315 [Selenomonadaceae bacterium]|nr:hypothetical protein [Selenomonadaceae bacterium]
MRMNSFKKKFKKKFLVGMLSGALIFASGLGTYKAFAAEQPNDPPQMMEECAQMPGHPFDHRGPHGGHHGPRGSHGPHGQPGQFRQELTEDQIAKFAKEIAARYNVSESEVAQALKDHKNMHDIQIAAMLAKLSNKSFAEVMAMKSDWREVGEQLGVTREQVKSFFEQERTERLATKSGLDTQVVNNLINDGYNPRDIVIAGKIAKAANKDVKKVLAKKKINNKWSDVATEFGVDFNSIMPERGRHNERGDSNPQ